MTNAPELKPCPFCGSNEIDPRSGGSPECSICGASACNSDWNTRADLSDAQAARIAGLEAERDHIREQRNFAQRQVVAAEAAEAKLAKLTTIFGHIAGCSDHDSALRLARAALAQLKGTGQ